MEDAKLSQTQQFSDFEVESSSKINNIFAEVYSAMEEKGYNPINQIVGYILSGDPTYITGYKNARSVITTVERDEILEELVNFYFKNNF